MQGKPILKVGSPFRRGTIKALVGLGSDDETQTADVRSDSPQDSVTQQAAEPVHVAPQNAEHAAAVDRAPTPPLDAPPLETPVHTPIQEAPAERQDEKPRSPPGPEFIPSSRYRMPKPQWPVPLQATLLITSVEIM